MLLGIREQCNKTMEVVQVQACLYIWTGGGSGEGLSGYKKVADREEQEEGAACARSTEYKSNHAFEIEFLEDCRDKGTYKGWVWAYARSGKFIWSWKSGQVTRSAVCGGKQVAIEETEKYFEEDDG